MADGLPMAERFLRSFTHFFAVLLDRGRRVAQVGSPLTDRSPLGNSRQVSITTFGRIAAMHQNT
jgi:hypothetical protein